MNKPTKVYLNLKSVPIESQRYRSIDDWFDPKITTDGFIKFATVVGNTGNWKYDLLVLYHALTEQILCYDRKISDKKVTEFDLAHIDHENPGELENAPYHKEHMIANDVESIMANALEINWTDYEKAIDKTLKKYKKGGVENKPK